MTDLTPILKLAAYVLGIIISLYVLPYIKSKTTTQQQAEINEWVRIAVTAAEQIYSGPGRGNEKKAYVIAWLANNQIKIDEKALDSIIESAVHELRNGLFTIAEGVENS